MWNVSDLGILQTELLTKFRSFFVSSTLLLIAVDVWWLTLLAKSVTSVRSWIQTTWLVTEQMNFLRMNVLNEWMFLSQVCTLKRLYPNLIIRWSPLVRNIAQEIHQSMWILDVFVWRTCAGKKFSSLEVGIWQTRFLSLNIRLFHLAGSTVFCTVSKPTGFDNDTALWKERQVDRLTHPKKAGGGGMMVV